MYCGRYAGRKTDNTTEIKIILHTNFLIATHFRRCFIRPPCSSSSVFINYFEQLTVTVINENN